MEGGKGKVPEKTDELDIECRWSGSNGQFHPATSQSVTIIADRPMESNTRVTDLWDEMSAGVRIPETVGMADRYEGTPLGRVQILSHFGFQALLGFAWDLEWGWCNLRG